MNISFYIILNHFFADFLCQTDRMATGKSKSMKWLFIHVITYTIAMTPFAIYMGYSLPHITWIDALYWLLLNGALHYVTDFFTSKWTSYLYKKHLNDPKAEWMYQPYVHWFFCAIGCDQVIHYACLYFSYQWITSY